MSNIFAAENNERIRLDNISRTIHMFAKMTNDEKRFARDNASKSSNVLSSRGIFLSVRESRDRRLRATPARIERGRLIPRKSSARARARAAASPSGVRKAADRGRSTTQGAERYQERTDTHKARRHAVHRRWGGARARCRRTLSK